MAAPGYQYYYSTLSEEKYEKLWDGKEVEVLFEEAVTVQNQTFQVGHTKEYIKVGVVSEEPLQNQFKSVQIGGLGQILR